MIDAVVAGAGAAGLSAALVLGRCRRRVLLVDGGEPRNARAQALHGYLTRDGTAPGELLRLGREELERYPSVTYQRSTVVDARRTASGFTIRCANGATTDCRALLLATGVVDQLPEIPGVPALYGRSVFHCPLCDGWEVRDRPLAVYGRGDDALALAIGLKAWSADVVWCTHGSPATPEQRQRLAPHAIDVRDEPIVRVDAAPGDSLRIAFAEGAALERRALFFKTGQQERSPLAAQLGCEFTAEGTVRTDKHEGAGIPGLYVAGDASHGDQLAIVAAAEGAVAASAIHDWLWQRDVATAEGGSPAAG